MLYFSHAVGGGAGGGSMRPTFGLRVQQIRQGANSGDPAEQTDTMQRRELINWQMEGHSNMRLAESHVKFGNKLSYDFSSHRFASPSPRTALQLSAQSLRSFNTTQPRPFAVSGPSERLSAASAGRAVSKDNGNFHEIAAAAMSALTPARFTAPQRPVAQRPGGLAAIISAQRMQSPTSLR